MDTDLDSLKSIYFVGIGGTSMSGLALMSHTKGFHVSGSDMRACSYTDKLSEHGVLVHIGHSAANVPPDADLLVYSAAIRQDNVELVRARELGIPLMERSYFLGVLSRLYPRTIAVSGTHGKTTTSSLISLMLLDAGLDPSVSVGGTISEIGGNSRVGDSEYFVIEACEFVDSFLHTVHSTAVVLNIEEDHLDYFTGGLEQITDSFRRFAAIVPDGGLLVINGDDPQSPAVMAGLTCRVQTFGIDSDCDWKAAGIVYDKLGKPSFDAVHGGEVFGRFTLGIPGRHNVMNSLAVIACGHDLGIPADSIARTLAAFKGAKRRFELRGDAGGVKVFEDYAHHPTELRVTIQACRNYEHNRLWVVFQPHTYSRTFFLFDGFVDAVAEADEVIFNDIYSDRESNDWDIYSEDLAKAVTERHGVKARVISEFPDIVQEIASRVLPGDIVLVAGSQSINQVAYDLVEEMERRSRVVG